MTYGECRHATMQLVFSDSIAGSDLPETYNNQADYLKAIPALVNDCEVYIATTVKRIPEVVPLSSLANISHGAFDIYVLPDNYWRMMNGGLVWMTQNDLGIPVYTRYQQYKLLGNDRIVVPKNVPHKDELLLEYYRFPVRLPDTPEDSAELDNTLEVQSVIPFYVAAHLVMYDDAFRYTSLWNAFETRIGRITEPLFTEHEQIHDVYGFGYDNSIY